MDHPKKALDPPEFAALGNSPSNPHLLKLAEVAQILDVPLSTAYEHARTGLFDAFVIRVGRQVRAHPGRFRTWLESGGAALAGGWRKDAA